MDLYITEKPSVAEALAKYFNSTGANFKKEKNCYKDTKKNIFITWAVGHLLYQNPPEAYNPEWKNWKLDTLPMIPTIFKKTPYAAKKEQYKAVISLIKDATTIINVGDPDREGQVLIDELLPANKKVKRLLLNALDETSIRKALDDIKDNKAFSGLSAAGDCRSEIDWLLGMNLTRFFSLKAREGGYTTVMSVGRVKAPTLALIVNREAEITGFKTQKYYNIFAHLKINGVTVKASFVGDRITAKSEAEKIVTASKSSELKVTDVFKKSNKQEIKELYSLDTLQIDADKYFGLSADDTLKTIQKLYESKYLSYPRSDCKYLPTSQFTDSPNLIIAFNEAQLLDVKIPLPNLRPPVFNDAKVSAHHAIVPTGKIPDLSTLSKNEKDLYLLVLKKYASIFFPVYEYESHKVILTNGKYDFTFTTKITVNSGWAALYKNMPVSDDAEHEQDNEVEISTAVKAGTAYRVETFELKDAETKPPRRYTEGSLIKAMNNIKGDTKESNNILSKIKGIGTPATRATIIKELIAGEQLSKKGKTLIPTEKGKNLIAILPEIITKADYTANMEILLDQLEAGKIPKQKIITEVTDFLNTIIKQKDSLKIVNKDFPCPTCRKGFLMIKYYKDPDTNTVIEYAKCNNTECNQITPAKNNKPKIITCPVCKKGFMISKKNSKTKNIFYACSCYPDCKTVLSEDDFNKKRG